jgi:hypothetical protein
MNISDLNTYRYYLNLLDIDLLQTRISRFRTLNFRLLEYKAISEEIMNIFNIDIIGHGKYCEFIRQIGEYVKGTTFFRVRDLPENDIFIPLKTLKSEQDLWAPPANIVKRQRLNRDNEPLLYTTPLLPNISIEEKRIEEGKNFILIQYEALSDISVSMIGCMPEISGLTSEENIKHKMINDFLRDEFIRDVGIGTEYLYKISETIAKDHFDLPPDVVHAWCYPSAFNKMANNVCFRENVARKKLKVNGFLICEKISLIDKLELHSKYMGKYVDGLFRYYPIGSKEQKEVFPYI